MLKKIASLMALLMMTSLAQAETLLIFSDRPRDRFLPAIEKMQSEFGVRVDFRELTFEQMLAEFKKGERPDGFVVKDLVYLDEAKALGLTAEFLSADLAKLVAPAMQDTQGHWIALTYRVRSLVFDPTIADRGQIKEWEDLIAPDWAGRLCVRSWRHAYNQALLADWVMRFGQEKATQMASALNAQLAQVPYRGDTAVLEAIANGACEGGLVNHYYLGQMLNRDPQFPVVMNLFSPKGGEHTNGTSLVGFQGTTKKLQLQQFAGVLLRPEIQGPLSAAHFDYPARLGVVPTTLIRDWQGTLSETNWGTVGSYLPIARQIIEQLGLN